MSVVLHPYLMPYTIHSFATTQFLEQSELLPFSSCLMNVVAVLHKDFFGSAHSACGRLFPESRLCPVINCQTPTSAKYIVINRGKYNRLPLKVIISIINIKQA